MGGRSLLTRAIYARSVPEHSAGTCLCNMHHPSDRQQPTLSQTANMKCNTHYITNVIFQDSLWAHTDTKQNCIYFVGLAFHHEQLLQHQTSEDIWADCLSGQQPVGEVSEPITAML